MLECSDFDDKTLSKLGEMLKSLESKRPELDAVLAQLTAENDPNGAVVSEEIENNKNADDSHGNEDGKTNGSKAAVTNLRNQDDESTQGKGNNKKNAQSKKGHQNAESTQGKGNNKKNKKSKKGKGSRKK